MSSDGRRRELGRPGLAPFPDDAAARAALETVLTERLIACGNIVPGMIPLFGWLGEPHPCEIPSIPGWTAHADAGTFPCLKETTGVG